MIWNFGTTFKNGTATTFTIDNLYVMPSGFVGTYSSTTFRGMITLNKEMIVATGQQPDGSSCLYIMMKEVGNFAQANLTGDWRTQSLVAGDSPSYTGWERGTMTVDGSGVATTNFTDVTGISNPNLGTLTLNNDGSITSSSIASFFGFMSSSHKTIVYGMNESDGGYTLAISHKADGHTYALSGIAGEWYGNFLRTSDTDSFNEWERAKVKLEGNAYTPLEGQDATGISTSTIGGTFDLTTAGVFSVVGSTSSLGYVHPDENLIIATQTQSEGSVTTWDLIILLKK